MYAKKATLPKTEAFPVIFNLASWSGEHEKFEDWLIAMLYTVEGFPKKFVRKLLDEKRIIPLLDGLDELARNENEEVKIAKRAACLASLDYYLRGGRKIVICCRTEEFAQMPEMMRQNAPIWTKVKILDLTEAQVLSALKEAYSDENDADYAPANNLLSIIVNQKYIRRLDTFLKQSNSGRKRNPQRQVAGDRFIKRVINEKYRSLIETLSIPFYFSTALEVFDRTSFDKHALPEDRNQLEVYLMSEYVNRKLRNTYNPKDFNPEQTRKWLKWLAGLMERKELVSFELVNLQPTDLLKVKRYQFVASFLSGMLVGLVYGLIIGVSVGTQDYIEHNKFPNSLMAGFIYFGISTLSIGLFIGLLNRFGSGFGVGGLFEDSHIETNDVVQIKLSKLFTWKTWISSFGISLLGGGIGVLFSLRFNNLELKDGFLIGIICGMLVGLYIQLRNTSYFVDIKRPYQRLVSLFFWRWVGWIITAVFFFALISYFDGGEDEVIGFLIVMMPLVVIESLFFTPLVKHAVLRLCFYLESSMPLKYVSFLDYAANARILEKDGGQWRFRHQNLQEYFANQVQ